MQKQSNSKKTTGTNSRLHEIIMTIFLCIAIQISVFLATCILSVIIGVKSEYYYIFAIASTCIGSVFSGYAIVRKTRKNGLINGILYALPSNIFFIFLSMIFNSFKINYIMPLSFVLLIISSGIGGILSVNFIPKTKIKTKR